MRRRVAPWLQWVAISGKSLTRRNGETSNTDEVGVAGRRHKRTHLGGDVRAGGITRERDPARIDLHRCRDGRP